MTSSERKNLVKMGVVTMRNGKGYKIFFANAAMAGAITFFALFGMMTILMGAMLSDYGVSRALAELHAVSAADAVMVLSGLLFKSLHMLVFASVVIGCLFGLKDVGEKELHARGAA